jgi:hypothetical protein
MIYLIILENLMKKAIPWVVGIFLILIGIANFANSIVAGLLALIAGLLFLPPIIKVLASKKQLEFLASNNWTSKVIATVLVIASITLSSSAQDEKLIASYNANPAKVTSEVKQALDQKDFSLAKIRLEKYLKVLPNNTELKTLMAQIESEKAEASKQVALNKQQETKNVAASTPQSGEVSDPDLIGKCLGYISKEVMANGGPQNLREPQKRYLSNHNSYVNVIVSTNKTYPDCFTPGVIIQTCLSSKNVNEQDIKLLDGYNTGIVMYKDSTKRVMMELSCAN